MKKILLYTFFFIVFSSCKKMAGDNPVEDKTYSSSAPSTKNDNSVYEEFFNVQILDEKISVKTKSDRKVLSNSEVLKVNTNCPQSEVKIVQKDNYFTIEKHNCDNTYYFKEYVTFKYSNGLFLHKYDFEYTDRRDPDKEIPTKKMTVKNFGKMKFEDVTDYFLLTLRQDK